MGHMPSASPSGPPGDAAVLASRYGRARRTERRGLSRRARLAAIVAALALASLFVAWIVSGQAGRPTAKDVGFDLRSSAMVTADVQVTRDPQDTVRCGIQALNESWATVGYTETEIRAQGPDDPRTVAVRVPIRTTNQANATEATGCWVVD